MQQQIVLVRGDCGKPVRLVAVREVNGLIFVSSERAAAAGDSDYPPPIGVPKSDVFRFDEGKYERLRSL
jgi:phenylpropionate dioxygenase-like ring-hydroxylating dioxygenase large terminal subunit